MAAQWRASTAHIEVVAKSLRTSKVDRKSPTHITITRSGLKVQTVAPSRVFNGQSFLESDLFATYKYESETSVSGVEESVVSLSVASLVNCLQMFAEWTASADDPETQTGCFFEYVEGSKFQLSFAHGSMTSVCDLRLFSTESVREITFDSDNVSLQVIMPATICLAMLRDIQAVSADEVEFSVQLSPAQLEVRATGELATADFVFPNEPGVLDALAADKETKFTFAFDNVVKCLEAIRLAKKVSLRFDEAGTSSIQCLCEFDELSAYIEFRVLANF